MAETLEARAGIEPAYKDLQSLALSWQKWQKMAIIRQFSSATDAKNDRFRGRKSHRSRHSDSGVGSSDYIEDRPPLSKNADDSDRPPHLRAHKLGPRMN